MPSSVTERAKEILHDLLEKSSVVIHQKIKSSDDTLSSSEPSFKTFKNILKKIDPENITPKQVLLFDFFIFIIFICN